MTDAAEEKKLAAKERIDKQKAAMNAMGNYNGPIKVSEDDEE